MLDTAFYFLSKLDALYWSYLGAMILITVGIILTFQSNFYQIRSFRHIRATIKTVLRVDEQTAPGVSPLRLFFTTAGGMIGLGNVIAVASAVIVGGPGALFWFWISALLGIIIKYSETYLGLKYRQINPRGAGYVGGPMYFITHAFHGKTGKLLAKLVAIFLCIYGVEIYQFTVVSETLHRVSGIDKEWMIGFLLIFTIYVGIGGVERLSGVCSTLMPIFIIIYTGMCSWVILNNIGAIPEVIKSIFSSAFTGHAAIGGFAGSSFWLILQSGASKAVYSADIAIGFDSLIQSESRAMEPQYQGRIVMLAMLLDSFICSLTLSILLVSGHWMDSGNIDNADYIIKVFKDYFPDSVEYLFGLTIFLVGTTTIQAYFVAGLKAANYLSNKWGKLLYFLYAISAFWIFAHYNSGKVMIIMSLSGGFLILINLISILRLRKEISFKQLKNEE